MRFPNNLVALGVSLLLILCSSVGLAQWTDDTDTNTRLQTDRESAVGKMTLVQ